MLSGDCLFVGDVARPDLAIEPRGGRRHLPLPARAPAGAARGDRGLAGTPRRLALRQLRDRPQDLLDDRLRAPPQPGALRFESEAEFVEDAVATIGSKPPNVAHIVSLNRGPLVESIGAPTQLTPHGFEAAIAEGALAIDSRTNEQFDEAHIPGSISASAYDTGFATKVAEIVPVDAELLVVAASDGNELEAAELLAAVGLRVRGFLGGGMTAWRAEDRPVERIEAIDLAELARRLERRRPAGARRARRGRVCGRPRRRLDPHPLRRAAGRLDELPREQPIATICKAGKRSGLAASILQREGFEGVVHVSRGNAGTWRQTRPPLKPRRRAECPDIGGATRRRLVARGGGNEAFGRVDRRGVPAGPGPPTVSKARPAMIIQACSALA